MIKRIISIALVIAIIASPMIQANAEEYAAFYEIPNCINPDHMLTFYVPSNQKSVYIDAEDVETLISEAGFDFKFRQSEDECALVSEKYKMVVVYAFDKKTVTVYGSTFTLDYRAPAVALSLSGAAWLPFEFTMNLFGMTNYSHTYGIEVVPPELTGIMALSYMRNSEDVAFNWQKELGYSDTELLSRGIRSKFLNTIDNMLLGDRFFATWGDVLFMSQGAFVEKSYAKDIAKLFMAPCVSEVKKTDDQAEYKGSSLAKIIYEGGDKISDTARLNKITVSGFLEVYEDDLKFMPLLKNNTKFLDKMEKLKKKSNMLDQFSFDLKGQDFVKFFPYIVEIYFYILNYDLKSETAAESLKKYAETADLPVSDTLVDYVNSVNSSDTVAIVFNYIKENLGRIVIDALPIDDWIGLAGGWALLGWNMLKLFFPGIKEGIESADTFELSINAIGYQNNAYRFTKTETARLISKNNINAKDVESAADFAYAYIKFSVIARNAAASVIDLMWIDKNTKKSIIERLDKKNEEISRILCALEDIENDYFPDRVKTKRSDWNTESIIACLEANGEKTVSIAERAKTLFDKLFNIKRGYITEEEAIEMCEKVMGRNGTVKMLESFIKDLYGVEFGYNIATDDFKAPGTGIKTYVVELLINDEPDYYHLFVPADGSAVWIGCEKEDGTYYCFTDVDLYNFSAIELFNAMKEIYENPEKQKELDEAM